jgi:murein L,D-transpeptidase YafK
MVHLSGNFALIRASLVRTLMASAVLAGALSLAGCYTDDGYQLPTRAMKELSPEMLTLLQQKNMPKESPILVRIFKEESELEVWKQDTTGRFEMLKVYPICRWSGELGPKVKEGDRQAPEGFYAITPGLMNPNSNYYLAINTGFPNAFDKANGYSGAFLMIHGDCSSRGCFAMTDEQIGEIYSLARESFLGGEKSFQIQAYPFRMTPTNLARHRTNPNMAFWKMIKEGNDHFEVSHLEPKVDVCDRHYVFDAQPANSTKPLVFTPTGRCPTFEVNPEIAGPALDKQRNDEYQIAQLISHNAPVAPVTMGTDGGMNRVFIAKLDQPTAIYDDEGHVHAPPVHPGMPLPTISAPTPAQDRATAIYGSPPKDSGSSGGLFAALFGSKPAAAPTQVATADADTQGQSSFFGSLFKPKNDAAQTASSATGSVGGDQPATDAAAPQKPKPAAAGLRLKPAMEARKGEPHKTEPPKSEPQLAETPKAKPQQDANAAPPASNNGLIKGAQPVVPAGTFDGRWAGLQ